MAFSIRNQMKVAPKQNEFSRPATVGSAVSLELGSGVSFQCGVWSVECGVAEDDITPHSAFRTLHWDAPHWNAFLLDYAGVWVLPLSK
jgi:hypothetical protein